jgi:hypothetical protein
MAVRQRWLTEWIATHGPWMFHSTEADLGSILSEGLKPRDKLSPLTNEEADEYTPRPGHVYVGTLAHHIHDLSDDLCSGLEALPNYLLAVDLSKIHPDRINPDEDAFWSTIMLNPPVSPQRWCLPDPVKTVKIWRDNATVDYDKRPYKSFGEWADKQKIGSDCDLSRTAIETSQTMAISGSISPKHLRLFLNPVSNLQTEADIYGVADLAEMMPIDLIKGFPVQYLR